MPGKRFEIRFHSKRSHNCGFALVALMIFLPMAIAVLAYLATLAKMIIYQSRAQALCERHAMVLQTNLSKQLHSLLSKNPKARALRIKHRVLEIELAAALLSHNEIEAGRIQAKIDKVEMSQGELDAKQKSILFRANFGLRSDANDWRKALRGVPGLTPFVTANILQVYATPQGAVAPEYETKSNFSTVQAVQATYQMRVSQILGGAIASILSSIHQLLGGTIHSSCGATLEKRDNRYIARLWRPGAA